MEEVEVWVRSGISGECDGCHRAPLLLLQEEDVDSAGAFLLCVACAEARGGAVSL